jgi:serine/threonine protein kinase
MNRCASCGGTVRTRDRFCNDCGVSLGPSSPAPGAKEWGSRNESGSSGSRSVVEERAESGYADVPRTIVQAALSNGPTELARFVPGQVLSRRYRVLSLLGRGGMGEVYRVDDLKLGQPVALKFLSQGLDQDPSRFRRFLNEVRLARQVAHPNVCRVYDVGDFEGQHFLSMEYIDGEDLASLLHRIGRLPKDKAVQIARQICLGLAAAHDQGILHRDLKPANIMIDGRGRVRLTDFGLAVWADELESGDRRTGTPAYMAPEQFHGTEVTHKSDIYAVGLVLYELFTGMRPFDADTPTGIALRPRESSPPSPSSYVSGLDPAVERIILSCLENDPANRPFSAVSVANALPGDDPLTEAIAAGETPAPELVAEGRTSFSVRPSLVWICLTAFIAALIAVVAAGPYTRSLSQFALDKPDGFLLERSREVVRLTGDPPRKTFEAHGYAPGQRDPNDSSGRAQATELVFWYRQSSQALVPSRMAVAPEDPPSSQPGMSSVTLDTQGRLRQFESTPSVPADSRLSDPEAAWDALFRLAEFDRSNFEPAVPELYPASYADTRAAWTTVHPPAGDDEIRVEAAALDGLPVFFRVVEPVTDAVPSLQRDVWSGINAAASLALFGPVLIGGLFLARHNLLQGRGDRKGAFRLATFMFGLWLAFGILGSDHFIDVAELGILFRALARACLSFGLFWVLYVALEPYARRYWPFMLISWIRLLDGRFRDPLLGWHLLVGASFGSAATLVEHGGVIATRLLGLPAWEPGSLSLQLRPLTSFRYALAGTLDLMDFAVTTSLQVVIILLVLRVLLRRQTLAAIGLFLVSVFVFAGPGATLPAHALIIALALVVLFRFGLLALMSGLFVFVLLGNYLISLVPTSPFAAVSYLAGMTAMGIATYGCRCTLTARPFQN